MPTKIQFVSRSHLNISFVINEHFFNITWRSIFAMFEGYSADQLDYKC